MAVAGCINAYDCAGCYLTTLQQLQSDNIGVAINYTAPWEYWRRQLDYIKYTDKCGCTCCLTGENELRIVATQWVIKNFTLTNDNTNEVVNVKWNDLFGSNRAYTMVRYKTWSYPTSITDGTLAVKEMTQNQYATNWYNVSWLTDWTTYYFTAFAVSQDGTIIVVQNKSITPDYWRKPWVHTVAYFPFETDATDHSWNWITLSNSWSKQTLWYKFQSASTFSRNLNTARFASLWCKVISWWWSWTWQVALIMYWWMCYNLMHWQSDFRNTIQFWNWSSWRKSWTWMSTNQRYNLAWSYDWSKAVMRVNATKTVLVNSSSYYSQSNADALISWSWYNIDLSKVIFEDAVPSDEDIIKYFNKTKREYWY